MGKSRQDLALAIIVVFPCLSTIIVGLRCWSRYLGRNFGWDDGLMLLALLLAIGESISGYGLTVHGWSGYHMWEIPKMTVDQKVVTSQWSFAYQMFYHPLMGVIRWSIISFLYRIQDMRRHIQIMLRGVWWINIGYIISTTLANFLQCTPVSYGWDKARTDRIVDGVLVPGGQCIHNLAFILSSCGLSIFMDIIIIPIPTLMVWHLRNMERRTKIAVAFVMSLGWIATGVSVGRFIVYYYRWQPDNMDRSYNIGHTISVAEANTAIFAACAPAMKKLANLYFPSYFSKYPTYASGTPRNHSGRSPSDRDDVDSPSAEVELGHQRNMPKSDVDKLYQHQFESKSESQERINILPSEINNLKLPGVSRPASVLRNPNMGTRTRTNTRCIDDDTFFPPLVHSPLFLVGLDEQRRPHVHDTLIAQAFGFIGLATMS